jgi:folate-dependent phosphoribosylglycinamide formyltransferase PurN
MQRQEGLFLDITSNRGYSSSRVLGRRRPAPALIIMKIVFLAVDDAYAGEMQRPLFEHHPEWIIGSVISSCRIYKKSDFQAALFLLSHCGWSFVSSMVWTKIGAKLFSKRRASAPLELAKKHGTPTFFSKNINDDSSRSHLAEWKPDLVISTNFNHFVGGRARQIGRIGTWNLHKSHLPHYRGMAPGFYALLNGEPSSGATLHVMDAGFDTGDILAQVKVPIRDNDSVFDLNMRVATEGGRMLAEFLERFDPSVHEAKPQPAGDWPTYSYPSRKAVREFRRKGLKFDRLREAGHKDA